MNTLDRFWDLMAVVAALYLVVVAADATRAQFRSRGWKLVGMALLSGGALAVAAAIILATVGQVTS